MNTSADHLDPGARRLPRKIRAFWPVILLIIASLACVANYNFSPWERAYRQQGVVVIRAQLDALPTVDAVRAESFLTDSNDDVLVFGQYPRHTMFDAVTAHYRQVVPASGWTFDHRIQAHGDTMDYCNGIFQGYHLSLEIECDNTQSGCNVFGSSPFQYEFALVGWITGSH